MRDNISTLTGREREALRLLAEGHDAKSIARHLGLSVHTIHERLRVTRRKLGVSSSREAARLLAEVEGRVPKSVTDKFLGVSEDDRGAPIGGRADHRRDMARRLAWFGGGMLIMSLIVAAVALSSALHIGAAPNAEASAPISMGIAPADAASLEPARTWLGLLDRHGWEESWRRAAPLFKSQITAAQWASTIRSVRQPLGVVSSRTFQSVTKAAALPGAPMGEYEVLQFQTKFSQKPGMSTETVTLAHDRFGWRVAGYFVR